jgi:hypothetical protein
MCYSNTGATALCLLQHKTCLLRKYPKIEGEAFGGGSDIPLIGYCTSVLLFYDIDMKVGTVTSSRPKKDTTCVEIGKNSMCE